jgi:hypothetical protein
MKTTPGLNNVKHMILMLIFLPFGMRFETGLLGLNNCFKSGGGFHKVGCTA